MVVYSVLVISKSGGLIYSYDNNFVNPEVERTFNYPLDLKLDYINQRIVVVFGQRDGIKGESSVNNVVGTNTLLNVTVGYSILAINGQPLNGRKIGDEDVLDDILSNESRFPLSIKLGIPKLTANEKIVLASMFHSMYAIAAIQLSCKRTSSSSASDKETSSAISINFPQKFKPPASSGIEVLETENFRLNCFQTLTGVKFLVISDFSHSSASKEIFLRKLYEIYTDYALKNPFYSLDMPIRSVSCFSLS